MAALAFPAIDPIALRLGPFAVRWYGLAYVAGFLFAWWILKVLDERWGVGLGSDRRTVVILAALVGLVAGGRLGYVIVYGVGAYFADPLKIFAIWDGCMSFHGGLVGIMLAGVWVSRRYKVPFLTLCDIGAVGAPMGLLLGRLANFINGELWGRVTTAPWGMVFPGGGPLPRHPSQLYEAALEGVVLLAVMLWLSRRQRPAGFLVGWMLTLYAVFRIFVEFFRQPDVQIGFLPGGVTMGQLLSTPMLIAGVWLIARAVRARRATSSGAQES